MERPLENIWFVSFLESNMKKLLQSWIPSLKCKGISKCRVGFNFTKNTFTSFDYSFVHIRITCYIYMYTRIYTSVNKPKDFFKNMMEASGEEWSSETNGAQFKWWSETIQVLPWDKCLKLPTYLPPLMYSILVLQLVRKERE